jgi:hypothetical protein
MAKAAYSQQSAQGSWRYFVKLRAETCAPRPRCSLLASLTVRYSRTKSGITAGTDSPLKKSPRRGYGKTIPQDADEGGVSFDREDFKW